MITQIIMVYSKFSMLCLVNFTKVSQ